MSAWEIIYNELKKEQPLTVLFFVFHYYYNRPIKELAVIFGMRPDAVSRLLNRTMANIRKEYTNDGGVIGCDADGDIDGHLIGGEQAMY
ncbi:hypothetical protein [Acinetobacter sp.]|uniref:hypothetical protein n=1 Tax=Acinetobacter sp. TaxID=472 RepID=UPI003D049EE9